MTKGLETQVEKKKNVHWKPVARHFTEDKRHTNTQLKEVNGPHLKKSW